jgi:hypothetical protein
MTRDPIHIANRLKKKILIIGDSHARGLASELNTNLGSEYAVTGTIMPGAKLDNVTNLARES